MSERESARCSKIHELSDRVRLSGVCSVKLALAHRIASMGTTSAAMPADDEGFDRSYVQIVFPVSPRHGNKSSLLFSYFLSNPFSLSHSFSLFVSFSLFFSLSVALRSCSFFVGVCLLDSPAQILSSSRSIRVHSFFRPLTLSNRSTGIEQSSRQSFARFMITIG